MGLDRISRSAMVRRGHGALLLGWLFVALCFPPCLAGAEPTGRKPSPPPSSLRIEGLDVIRRLAEAGAPELALRRLSSSMPGREEDPVEWLRWEKTRIVLLRRLGDTDRLLEEMERVQNKVDSGTADWLYTQAIESLLESGRPREARKLARQALWHRQEADARERHRWRVAILQAWLAEERLEEARVTLLRLEQDYPETGNHWTELHARILLQLGDAKAAWSRLRDSGKEATPLALLAGLKSGAWAPEEVLARTEKALQAGPASALAAALWRVKAESLIRLGRPGDALVAFEEVALHQPSRMPELFDVSGDTLWQAYLTQGHALGNRLQLLRGRDEDWYFAATERFEKAPAEARALLAVLAREGSEARHRVLAHEYLSRLLDERDPKGRLLGLLYLRSSAYPAPEKIPDPVRRRLVEIAVDARDVALASRLAAGLPPPPEGDEEKALEWNLLRARLLILGGQVDAGTDILRKQLQSFDQPIPKQIDRILQVVFDLQQIDEHARALELFDRIARLPLDDRHRRELWYWVGESRAALGRHREAGEAFLLSAAWKAPHAMDPWAQTARYHAAIELEKAGLLRDALDLLDGLRRATKDPARRQLIEHRMQRVRARQEKERRRSSQTGERLQVPGNVSRP